MDIRQMKYIVAIAEKGSISKAAEDLYISQSGLNQQLIKIEKELGTKLFERDTHSLKITEAGDVVLAYARDAIFRDERLKAVIEDVVDGTAGEIRLNLAMEQGINMFTHVFPKFHEKYPKIKFSLEDHIVYDQYDRLLNRQLDIGMVMISKREIAELEYIHIVDERFLLGIPKGHPLEVFYQKTDDGDYPIMDLALCKDEEFSLMFEGSTMRQVIDPCFEEAGFKPKIMFESYARTNTAVGLMVSSGICLTIMPESQAWVFPDIRWFRLSSNPTWEACLTFHHENPPRKAARYFIKLAIEYGEWLDEHKKKPVWD